jgi:serine/threonine protein phosphatase 1
MKTFVVGDIHGAHRALLQCIERSEINKSKDRLIVLGDVVDGWNQVPECIDTLLEFKKLIAIRGNHDDWFMSWYRTKIPKPIWLRQGGQATFNRYNNNADLLQYHMEEYFNKTKVYYVDKKTNYAYMHGGYDWTIPLKKNDPHYIMWTRNMIEYGQNWYVNFKFNLNEDSDASKETLFPEFRKIFVGHTTTEYAANWRYEASTAPAFLGNLINLDTGAGWNGKLTIMNADTNEYWQSDKLNTLYNESENAREQFK